MRTRFAGVSDLYDSQDDRAMSPEVDFGVGWHGEAPWPTYRVSWIERTGEMYLVMLTLAPGNSYPIELLDGVQRDRLVVDAAFYGWEEVLTLHDSVQWARDRWANACA